MKRFKWILWGLCLMLLMAGGNKVQAAFESESNNSRNEATVINVNETVSGSLSDRDDVDWYKFTTTKDGVVTLQFNHPNLANTRDFWEMYLFHEDGTTRIDGNDCYWIIKGDSDLKTAEMGIPAGSYYIKINRKNWGEYSNVTYTFKAIFTESSFWEKEANDSAAKANSIKVNQAYSGSVCDSYDVDWFTFSTTKDGMISVQFDHSNLADTGEFWYIDLYHGDGTSRIDGTDDYWGVLGNSNTKTAEIGVPAGNYYIKIGRKKWSDSTYTLKVNYTASDVWEKEKNNSAAQASKIDVNKEYCASVSNRSDVDWYSFSTDKDGMISVQFDHPNLADSRGYWEMYLYHEDGTTKIDGEDCYWFINGDSNLKTAEMGIPAGSYYIMVNRKSWGEYSDLTYTLRVDFSESGLWEKEINNTAAKASSINVNQAYSGSICGSYDVDWYTFTTTKDGMISVQFNHPNLADTGNFWYMTLLCEDGTSRIDGDDANWRIPGDANAKTAELGVPAGKYYIKIGRENWSDSTYTFTVNFTASDAWEKEINNSAAKANNIKVNKEYHGSVSSRNDADWYSFTTAQDGMINVQFDHDNLANSEEFWEMTIFHDDGTTRVDGDDCYWVINGASNLKTAEIGLPAGNYYIKVCRKSWSNLSSITYIMKVNYTESDLWEKEINDSVAKASAMKVNQSYSGSICGSRDVDWYTFTTKKDGVISIQFNHPNLAETKNYWQMRLYKNDGTSSIPADIYWYVRGNEDAKTEEIGLPAGTYYIKVSRDTWSDSTYTLKVNYTESDFWEKENNGSVAGASNIRLNQKYNGSISHYYDDDWYVFTVNEGEVVSLRFTHPNLTVGTEYWEMSLFQSNGTTQVTNKIWKITGNADCTTEKIGLAPGKYYVKITHSGWWNFDSSTYTLTVSTGQPGDINGDGTVNIFDVIRLLKKVTGENVATFANTDVNNDGKVNIFDVIRLLKFVTGEKVEVH